MPFKSKFRRGALLIAALAALAACSTLALYTPEDHASSVEGMYCGTPYAWWRVQAAGVTASLAAQTCPQGLCGTLRLAIPATSRVTFAGNAIAVASDDESGSLALAERASGAGVQVGTVVPHPADGAHSVDYVFAGAAPVSAKILLAAPVLIVDGQRVALPPAKMVLVERKTAVPCLQ